MKRKVGGCEFPYGAVKSIGNRQPKRERVITDISEKDVEGFRPPRPLPDPDSLSTRRAIQALRELKGLAPLPDPDDDKPDAS